MSIFKKYRKKYVVFFFFLLWGQNTQSQHFFVSLFGGSSNYSGDLQEKAFTFTQAHPAFGFGLLYEVNAKFLIRGDFTYGNISAHDKFSAKNKDRNLSFKSNLYEYSLGLEYTFFNLYNYSISPYIFSGISIFDFNPFTKDVNDNIVFLAELGTEGQGFYEGRKDYKLRQYSIPMGGGIQWAINDNKRIGFVVGFRKTFTDYIDDVSTTYVDEATLTLQRGQKVSNIAYRGDELNNGLPYPAGGSLRGNPKSKDSYYFAGLTFRVRLLPKRKEWRYKFDFDRKARPSLKCPTVF